MSPVVPSVVAMVIALVYALVVAIVALVAAAHRDPSTRADAKQVLDRLLRRLRRP